MTERRYIELNAEIRTADDGGKRAFGLAIPYNSWSVELGDFREKIAPQAVKRSLAEANNGERNIFAYWSHDNSLPLGSTKSGKLKLEDREDGLYFELDTSRLTTLQADALADGDMRMSFGFIMRSQEWTDLEDGMSERTILDMDLLEVSPVTFPAYPATEASLRSAHDAWKEETASEIETVEEKRAEVNTIADIEFLKVSMTAQLNQRGIS